MDRFYRGIEASLLALSLALGLGAATLSGLTSRPATVREASIALPMITVTAGEPDE